MEVVVQLSLVFFLLRGVVAVVEALYSQLVVVNAELPGCVCPVC